MTDNARQLAKNWTSELRDKLVAELVQIVDSNQARDSLAVFSNHDLGLDQFDVEPSDALAALAYLARTPDDCVDADAVLRLYDNDYFSGTCFDSVVVALTGVWIAVD